MKKGELKKPIFCVICDEKCRLINSIEERDSKGIILQRAHLRCTEIEKLIPKSTKNKFHIFRKNITKVL